MCARAHTYTQANAYMHTHTVYVCMCMCTCACVWSHKWIASLYIPNPYDNYKYTNTLDKVI